MRNIFCLLACGLLAAGCADLGRTEPVLMNDGRGAYQPVEVREVRPAVQLRGNESAESENSAKVKRELAAMRADLDAAREEQKILIARIEGLEQDNIRKDGQIKELQSLLDSMDRRFADVDKGWRDRMGELSATIDRERQNRKKELDNFTTIIASEIGKKQGTAAETGAYSVLAVQKGDTLSAIAAAARVSIAELKRINNLKSDVIYEGQKLKVPVK